MLKHQFIISLAILIYLMANPFHSEAECRVDSTGMESKDGIVYIIHHVEANETWFALSRRYNVKVEDLMAANANRPLKTNELVYIPTELNVGNVDSEVGENVEPQDELVPVKKTPVFYKVKFGETLYSISKKFNKSIFALKEWNSLATDELKEGTEIIVNYIVDFKEPTKLIAASTAKVEPATEVSENDKVTQESDKGLKQIQKAVPFNITNEVIANDKEGDKKKKKRKDNDKPLPPAIPVKLSKEELKKLEATQSVSEIKTDNSSKVIKKFVETGIGAYVSDVNLNQNRYYALHRTAPKGTIIKVTNSMNGLYVYVKVVGTLPDTGDNHNQVVKVSEAAAKKMGVLDTYFRAELTYGVADE